MSQHHVKAVPIRRFLQMHTTNAAFFTSLWRMHHYYPSWPHISQDALKKKVRMKMAVSHGIDPPFAGLGSRNCDERVKHLVTQPGNAAKARPSHLTTADVVNKVSL